MSQVVSIQTLRGTNGVAEAQKVVSSAVAKFNETSKVPHVAEFTVALQPNTKGMQFRLTLIAQLARQNGCTMIRLSVHGGEIAVCGPAAQVREVLDNIITFHNVLVTQATSAYNASIHGKRMPFMNGYECGLASGLFTGAPQLAYGVGMLFQFPKPGDGKAYDLGAAAMSKVEATPAPAPTKSTRARKAA